MENDKKKYRHELKYLCTSAQLIQIENRIRHMLQLDIHAREKGSYIIKSVYFDDMYDTYFNENPSGADPREKFRIRTYNNDDRNIHLELKKKERNKTLKISCPITREQCMKFIRGEYIPVRSGDPFVLQKLCMLRQTQMMKPRVIVEYTRIPYVYHVGTVRITFDKYITSSSACEDFFEQDTPKRLILPVNQHIMEVKFNEFLPDFIYQQLHTDHLQYTAFSKYFLCRKYNTKGEIINELQ